MRDFYWLNFFDLFYNFYESKGIGGRTFESPQLAVQKRRNPIKQAIFRRIFFKDTKETKYYFLGIRILKTYKI